MYEDASNSTILLLINTAIIPFIVTVIIAFLLSKLAPSIKEISISATFIAALALIHTSFQFPPKTALDFLVITALIGVLLVFIYYKKLTSMPSYFKHITIFVTGFVSSFFLLNPVLKHGNDANIFITPAVISLLTLITYELLVNKEPIKDSTIGKHSHLLYVFTVSAVSSPVIGIGGSLLISQLLGALSAILFAFILLSILLKQESEKATILALFILSGLLSQAYVLADIPLIVIFGLWSSFWVALLIRILIKNDIQRFILHTAASTTIAAVSLWYVWPASSLY